MMTFCAGTRSRLILFWIEFIPLAIGQIVSLDVSPGEVIHGLTRRLDLTCSLKASTVVVRQISVPKLHQNQSSGHKTNGTNNTVSFGDIRQVMSVYIHLKSDLEQPVASVTYFSPATSLKSLNTSEAFGHVNTSLDPRAYLRVSWSPPDEEQNGNYTCVVHAIDALGLPVNFTKSAEVTVREPTAKELVGHISNLDSHVANQNQQIGQLQSKMKKLIARNQRMLIQQMAADSMMSTVLSQLAQMRKKLDDMSSEFQNTQSITFDQKIATQRHPLGVGFTSQFFSSPKVKVSEKGILKFNSVVTNIGGHYNPSSGTFTAPAEGTYLASVSIRMFHDTSVKVDIVHYQSSDGIKKRVCPAKTSVKDTSSGCVGIVAMKEGDMIGVEATDVSGDPSLSLLSTFSCASLN